MTDEIISKAEDLLDDAYGSLTDKKGFNKKMNEIIKDCALKNGVDKSALKRVKNYHHYKGKNWLNNDPLKKDPAVKEKDKVAPVFIKLAQIYQDLSTIGYEDLLDDYANALEPLGIHLSFERGGASTKEDRKTILEAIDSASKLQTNIDAIAGELKDVSSAQAEEIGFTPKSAFMSVLGIYEKIKDGKDVKDAVQQGFANASMTSQAYYYLSSQMDMDADDTSTKQQ